VGASRVLVVDGDPGDTPTRSEVYFLERALAPWGGGRSGVTPDVVTHLGLLDLDPDRHQVVFLANVADPRPFAPKLSEFVRKGGSVVITVGENVSPERYNAALGGLLPAPLKRTEDLSARGEPGVALAPPQDGTDLFEPFARSGRGAFASVRSRRVVLLDPYAESSDVTTLLRYESGVPALVERTVGQGRVLLWTSTIDYDWSTIPTQAVFMPLVQRLVDYLGGEASTGGVRLEGIVGQPLSIELPDLSLQPEVFGPDEQPVRSRIEGTWLFFTPEEPGSYRISMVSSAPLGLAAVNLAPEESDVRRYDSVAAAEADIRPELFQRHVDLSPWLFALALGVLLLQAALSVGGKEEPS
jgi:hypothetical protein